MTPAIKTQTTAQTSASPEIAASMDAKIAPAGLRDQWPLLCWPDYCFAQESCYDFASDKLKRSGAWKTYGDVGRLTFLLGAEREWLAPFHDV